MLALARLLQYRPSRLRCQSKSSRYNPILVADLTIFSLCWPHTQTRISIAGSVPRWCKPEMSLEVPKKMAVIISDLDPDSIDSPKCILQEIAGLLQS
jgi:hypothetical protein